MSMSDATNTLGATVSGAAAVPMRCWQSGEPGLDGLALVAAPRPQPGPDQALIRVEAAALNFSDLLMLEDRYQVRPPRPFVPGQEVAGTVAEVGERSGLAPGDRIASKVTWGGLAEYALVRGDMAIRIPAGMPMAAAATLPVVYTTAMVALTERTVVRPGETVLVLAAAGGVGLASVEIARHLGARVIAAAGGVDKCAAARAHGADEAVDYRREAWGEVVKKLTGGRGVDVVVDPVGGPLSSMALRLLARDGRLLIVGFSSGDIPQIPANRLLLRRLSAIGVYWSHDDDGPLLARMTKELTRLFAAGAIKPRIAASHAFEELPAALAALSGRETVGKVVLTLATE
jgi:NADPH2:quinone reductase